MTGARIQERTTSPADQSTPQRGLPLAVVLAAVVVIAPAFVVQIPTLWDFPNHLVRLWILAGQAEGTRVAEMYRPDWSLARTNIGIDILAVILARLLPIEAVGQVLVASALVAAPAGVIALNRSLFGGWHWWHIAVFLLAWNFVIVGGLLSFQIGLGLALLAASLERRLETLSRPLSAAIRIACATLVMTVHVFALPFYLLLLLAIDIGPDLNVLRDRGRLREIGGRLLVSTACCLVPLAMLLLFARKLPGAHVNAPAAEGAHFDSDFVSFPPTDVLEHLSIMITAVKTYALGPDLLTLAALTAIPLYCLARRQLAIHQPLFLIGWLLVIASNFMPSFAFGTGFIDKRLPLMAGLILGASIRPVLTRRASAQALLAAVMLVAVAARSLWISSVWLERQSDVAAIARAASHIPAGASVLLTHHYGGAVSDPRLPLGRYAHGEPIFMHMPVLITMWRHAFVPTVFTAAGKQPLQVLPPWRANAVPEGVLPRLEQLDDPDAVTHFHYLRDWRNRFDFVLVVNADIPDRRIRSNEIPGLTRVADEGFATLYRVTPRGP